MSKRKGDWIQTYTGKAFWPFDPRPEDVYIEDIAHALSLQCRFGGHVRELYSVAQHCVLVSKWLSEYALWGLLHDASEAYLVDLPRPLKRNPSFTAYREVEDLVMQAVCKRFGLEVEMPIYVKLVDNVLFVTEQRDLMAPPPMPWKNEGVQALTYKIVPWTSAKAEKEFLHRYNELVQ